MPRTRWLSVALIVSFALLASIPAAAQGVLTTTASCTGSSEVTVSWTFEEPFGLPPTDFPLWIGYDLYRRSMFPCGEFERVNDIPYPRLVGVSHTTTATVPVPLAFTPYEFRVVMVDALRQDIGYPTFGSDFTAHAGCPSTPMTVGILSEEGGLLWLTPCNEALSACFPAGYIEGPVADELRPYVGNGNGVVLFGDQYCGTVEGCAFNVSSWQLGFCQPLPTQTSTFGRVKAIYR